MSLENYLKGDRFGEKAYELEKEAMQDPFLQDAIDGYDQEDDRPTNNLKKLKNQLKKKTKRNSRYLQLWGIAIVGVLVIIGLSIFYFLYGNDNKEEPIYVTNTSTELITNTKSEVDTLVNTTDAIVNSDQTEVLTEEKDKAPALQEKRTIPEESQRLLWNQRRERNEELTSSISRDEIQEILSTYVDKQTPAQAVNVNANATPKPASGEAAYSDYIKTNRKPVTSDPGEMRQGKVILMFNVNESGRPVDISVLRSLNQAADKEAIRLLQNGPKWTASDKNAYLEVEF